LEKDWDTVLLPEGGKLSKSIVSKIVLARCLVNFPKALLLENMITYLDPIEKSRVLDYILNGNWTVLMISEDSDTIRKFPRVIKIDMGNLIFDDSSEEYLNNYNN
jgi:ABC-type multidrug transport system fused ATPase/permease subunit